jgi:hypothetical protein
MGSNRPPHAFEDCEPAFTTDPYPEPETPPEAVSLGGLEPLTSSLSGMFVGCAHAGRARVDLLNGWKEIAVVVRSIPRLSI